MHYTILAGFVLDNLLRLFLLQPLCHWGSFRALIDDDCKIPNWYRVMPNNENEAAKSRIGNYANKKTI